MVYAAPDVESRISKALLIGQYAPLYWSAVCALALAAIVLGTTWLTEFLDVELPRFQPGVSWALGAIFVVTMIVTLGIARGRMVWLAGIPAVLLVLSLIPLCTRSWVAAGVVSGLLVNWAAIGKRILIVVPSQTHGSLLPYGSGSYSPTWVEISIIVGLFAVGTLLYTLFVKVFPIMEIREEAAAVEGGEVAPQSELPSVGDSEEVR